jgi:tetratricopeptide (TPR) repeat protein
LKKDTMINTINTTIMKTKVILLVAALTLTFGSKAIAQMDDCAITLSLFVEPAKAKNYAAALPHYEKLVQECPKYSLATYQYGEKMFKSFIDAGDANKLGDYVKNLEMRLANYPSKTKQGDVLVKIAQLKFDNNMGSKMDQFNAFDNAFKKDEENFKSPKALYTYFSLAIGLYEAGQKPLQDVFDLYDTVTQKIEKEEIKLAKGLTQYMDKQDAGTALTSKEQKRMKAYETNLGAYGKVKGSVDGKLGILADCPNLIPLYEKDFEEKKNDVAWLKRAAGRLNSKDCDTPLFFRLVQQLNNLEPSAKTAFYLGRLKDKEGNSAAALDFYNQAAELETNPSDKAKVYYSIAENFRKKGSLSSARSYYLKMVEAKPSAGIAYLKIANMYAASANNCGSTPFEKRAINWKAAEMADKAARVDASIAGTARSSASSYRERAPGKSEIFNSGMGGKTISFKCWVGGSVRVPAL